MTPDLWASAALFAGPLLAGPWLRSPRVAPALAAFVTVVVFGLVLGHIAPHVVSIGGGWAIFLLALGYVGSAFHHRLHPSPPSSSRLDPAPPPAAHDHETAAANLVALCALLVHMLLEGLAIAAAPAGAARAVMAAAVGVHRVPIGLAVWWVTRPRAGRTGALALLLLGAVLTHVGYLGATALSGPRAIAMLAYLQAALAGSLLHVVGAHMPQGEGAGARSRAGAAAGVAWMVGTALATHATPGEVGLQLAATVVGVAAHVHGTRRHASEAGVAL